MENDFVVLLNDLQIKCNKKFVESNFEEFYRSASSGNQLKIQIEGGSDFIEVTKSIFQGKHYEITNENYMYLDELSHQIKSKSLQTKLNSFYYKHECDVHQIDQHPSIKFLVEISSLVHKLSISNYEDISTQIKQKLAPLTNEIKKSEQIDKSDENKNSQSDKDDDKSENEEESEEENEEFKTLSLAKIGNKSLNKLFYFEIVNTLSIGFNSIEQLKENQNKIQIIIQILQELDLENQSKYNSEGKIFFNNFINYVIEKYIKIKNQKNSITNYRQETLYLIHYLLSKKLIEISQIHQSNDPIELYFLEFFSQSDINQFFNDNESIVEFLENNTNESKPKNKGQNKNKNKKKQQDNDDENKNTLFIDFLSTSISNGLLTDNELINTFLDDDINKFKKSFNDNSINSFIFPTDISNISCLSALHNISLIELSAYFGSQNIFEYLNNKRIKKEIDESPNLPSIVIIGQHPQVIKSFLSGINSTDSDLIFEMLSFCNDHHFKDTYEMIINTINNCPKPEVKELDQYAEKCVVRSYFDIIPDLLMEGASINNILNLFCKSNNEVGIEYILEFSYINVNAILNNTTPLEYCLNNKNHLGCILLIKNDSINLQAIDSKSATGETILHTSCRLGLSKVVSYLLRNFLYDVNLPTKDGVFPIHFACLSGDYDTVTSVIRAKKVHLRTKVKSGPFMKRTVLHFASCSGNARIITLLLDSDSRLDINDVDYKGRTPLIYAIKGNFVNCVHVLLEQENVDINQEYKNNNLLQYACYKNKNEVFDVLLNDIVFDPDQPSSDGRVILVVAIENHNAHMVKSILDKYEHNVNVNIDTNDGKTPLIIACELGDLEIVKLLLDHDDIDLSKPASSDGTTPFMAAAKSGNVELIELLRQNSDEIDIYALNKVEMNAIHMAFFAEKIEAINYLLPLFIDKLNDKTKNGETLFQIACKRGSVKLSKLLINQPGVDINVCDNEGMTPFLWGVKEGKFELIKALVESNKCNINDSAKDGKNAFLIAVELQNMELIKYFIDLYSQYNKPKSKSKSKSKKNKQNENNNLYVDINAKTAEDRSALFIALKLKNREILHELISCPLIDINEDSRERTFLCKVVKKMTRNNFGISFSYNEILDLALNRNDLDVNKPSRKYDDQTCLHVACKSSNHNIRLVNKLLKIKGINVNAQSKEGTPLFLLIKYQSSYFKGKDGINNNNKFIRNNINNDKDENSDENESNNEEENENENNDEEESENESNNDNEGMNVNINHNMNDDDINEEEEEEVIKNNINAVSRGSDEINENNYWCDILNYPKLDINKGGDPSFEDNDINQPFGMHRAKKDTTKKTEYETPLELAILTNCNEIAEAILSIKGVDINSSFNLMKQTPLHLAITHDNYNLASKLISTKGIKLDIQDKAGSTPLLLALRSSNPKIADITLTLLKRKDVIKSINLSNNKEKITPFLVAVSNPSRQIFDSIIEIKDIDLESVDKKGRTALYLLAKNINRNDINDIEERIVILHQKCPSLLNLPNNSGKTPLFRSISRIDRNSKKAIDIVSYFLDQDDIDLSVPDDFNISKKASDKKPLVKYTSLLHVACSQSIPMIVEKLIPKMRNYYNEKEKEENIFTQKNESGNTILNIACSKRDLKTVDKIINYVMNPDNGIDYNNPDEFDINQESSCKVAPLHSICQIDSDELLLPVLNKILSIESLDINSKASNGFETALHFACLQNNKTIVDTLIKYPSIDPNARDNNGNTPLLIAALKDEYGIIKRLLRLESIDVNLSLPLSNKTPLYIACERWNFKIVKLLLNDQRTLVNCQEYPSGKTPLMHTINEFKADLFHIILNDDRIDINVSDKDKLTVLHYACIIGKIDFIKDIISLKKDGNLSLYLNAQTKEGLTPLHYACKSNNKEAILFLLGMKNNIDINIRDNKGRTALDLYLNNPGGLFDDEVRKAFDKYDKSKQIQTNANIIEICENGHYDMIKYIMSSNFIFDVNDNSMNDEKLALLHYLCKNQKVEIIEDLLNNMDKFDVNMNVVDINEMTPLHHAAISCFDETIVKLLLNTNKCDINAKDNKGRTALHYACEKGKKSIIEELLKYKEIIDVNIQDKNKSTPLHEFAKSSHFDNNILEILLKSKCNPNIADNKGNTPLHFACLKENNLFVSTLIDLSSFEIDPNIINKKYQTPLCIVCMKNDNLIFNTLFSSKLKTKIDINLASPIYIAALKGNFFLVEQLLDMPGIDVNSNLKNHFDFYSDNENGNDENEEDDEFEFDFSGLSLLHILAYSDSNDLLKKLIQSNQFDINKPTDEHVESKLNGTPLIIALKNNQLKNLYLLLDYYKSQLDLSIYDRNGKAAVHYCLELANNSLDILRYLIEIDDRIVNMETNNQKRETPLLISLNHKNVECSMLLLQQPSINVFCYSNDYNTPIHYIASDGKKEIIDSVLMKINSAMKDADDSIKKEIINFVNIQNSKGETALLIGCKNNNYYFVKTLVDTFKNMLDFSKSNDDENSPFMAAIRTSDDELIHLLLSNDNCMSSVDLSKPIDENNNYIFQLMAENSNVNNFKLFMEQASSQLSNMDLDFVNYKNNNGKSLVTIAAERQNAELFDFLCDSQDPDLNVLVGQKKMPLIFKAAESYDAKIFESILKHGSFDLNKDFDGKTVLHYACESYNEPNEKVKLLIKQNNIDVNCTTKKGSMTPLHLAAKKNNTDIVETLLSLDGKIDITILNSKKRTARDMTRNKNISKLFFDYDIRNKKNES